MDTIKLSPDAIAAFEAIGQIWRQLSPMEQGYVCGKVNGRLEVHSKQAAKEPRA